MINLISKNVDENLVDTLGTEQYVLTKDNNSSISKIERDIFSFRILKQLIFETFMYMINYKHSKELKN